MNAQEHDDTVQNAASGAAKIGLRSRGRGWTMLLGGSLTLNLLLMGLIGGSALHHGRSARGDASQHAPRPNMLTAALTPEDRRALLTAFRQSDSPAKADRQSTRAGYAALLAPLRADPYDSAVVAALLQENQNALVARSARAQMLLASRLAEMRPSERRAFADRLEQRLNAAQAKAAQTARGKERGQTAEH